MALWKGDLSEASPVLVRMHALDVLNDVLGDETSGKAGELQKAMSMIGEASLRSPFHRATCSAPWRAVMT